MTRSSVISVVSLVACMPPQQSPAPHAEAAAPQQPPAEAAAPQPALQRVSLAVHHEGPVGRATGLLVVQALTESGFTVDRFIEGGPDCAAAELSFHLRTTLQERETFTLDKETRERDEDLTVTDVDIEIVGCDARGAIVYADHLNHTFALRISEGLDNAARNLMRPSLSKLRDKVKALKNSSD